MKRMLFCIFVFAFPVFLSAQTQPVQKGTIIRMRMTDCLGPLNTVLWRRCQEAEKSRPGRSARNMSWCRIEWCT